MDIFIARQPIFNRQQKVTAYELLYRGSSDNFYNALDGDQASYRVIENLLLFGLDTLSGGKKIFINFTKKLLEEEIAVLLPKDLMVIEILENIEPDPQMISACRKLKDLGYTLALDDFSYDDRYKPLIQLADIIKVDFLATRGSERAAIIDRVNRRDVKFCAEKVETWEDFHQALEMGYSRFQGYFFCKPIIEAGKDIPSSKFKYLQLLQELNDDDLDFDRIEEIMCEDVSLSYKLLKLVNSAYFGFRSEIGSLKQAMVLLGQKGLRKWLLVITLNCLAGKNQEEMVKLAVCRANFSELLAVKCGFEARRSEFFIMGLFSLLDVFLNSAMDEIMAELPINDDIKAALLGEKNAFREVYELVLDYENGDWGNIDLKNKNYNHSENEVMSSYLNSLELTKYSNQ